jgi:hypothetical protein
MVGKAVFSENRYLATQTKSTSRAQKSNQFATLGPHQALLDNKVVTVHNEREMIARMTPVVPLDELD